MDIEFIIQVVQILSAVVLVALILLQKSEAGVGGAFGGGGDTESGVARRRGADKVLFVLSIIFLFLFLASVFAALLY